MPPFSPSARHVLNHGHARAIRAALFFKSAWTCAHLLVQVAVDKTKRQQVHGYQTCRKKMPACAELQRLDRNLLWASCPTHHQQLLPKSSQNQGNGWHYNVLTWFVLCDFCMEEKSALWGWAWQKQTMWDRWSIAFKSLIRLLVVFGSSGFLHYAEFGSCGFCTGMRLVQGLRRN